MADAADHYEAAADRVARLVRGLDEAELSHQDPPVRRLGMGSGPSRSGPAGSRRSSLWSEKR